MLGEKGSGRGLSVDQEASISVARTSGTICRCFLMLGVIVALMIWNGLELA